jgi:hypothetical protein
VGTEVSDQHCDLVFGQGALVNFLQSGRELQ